MPPLNLQTPGVYIQELSAFPNSVVTVPTAVPAFIGYTPQASWKGESYFNKAQKISSLADFEAYYCYPHTAPPAQPAKQYNPQYYLVKQHSQPTRGNYIFTDNAFYSILPDPNSIYYLYNSIRLFYQNGGGDAYIVSVGTYGPPSGITVNPGDQIINPNVNLAQLLSGLALLKKEKEPTMYICPEATLLSVADNSTLMQQMLLQCAQMQTAISIFDIIGAKEPDPVLYSNDIATFRNSVGMQGLDYGAAYYPFVGTNIVSSNEIDYTNLFAGDTNKLAPLLNPAGNPNPAVAAILASIQNPASGITVNQNNQALLAASPVYNSIMQLVLNDVNLLPASAGMAGVITSTDNNRGVWQAPANTSIVSAVALPINISSSQQANLNVDPVSGKSINVIRLFIGQGILVWGARTLDGNSMDYRYLSVRRTLIMLEQSCKLAVQSYIFEPNNSRTWVTVTSMLSNFLTTIWQQGGLFGAKPSEAFSVQCGLGSTMTGQDILNGVMNITITVALQRPAEFIVISFQQQMQQA